MSRSLLITLGLALGLALGLVGIAWFSVYKSNRLNERNDLRAEVAEYLVETEKEAVDNAMKISLGALNNFQKGEFYHRKSKVGAKTVGLFSHDLEPALTFLVDLERAVHATTFFFNYSSTEQQALFDCNGGFNGFAVPAALQHNLGPIRSFKWQVSDLELTTEAITTAQAEWATLKETMDVSLQTASALALDDNPWRCVWPDEVDEEQL